jgi:hypothetical protein
MPRAQEYKANLVRMPREPCTNAACSGVQGEPCTNATGVQGEPCTNATGVQGEPCTNSFYAQKLLPRNWKLGIGNWDRA